MRYVMLALLVLLIVPVVSAEVQTFGKFRLNECISLKQTCSNCTYNNISSIVNPNSSQVLGQVVMTRTDTTYNYTFCNTTVIGPYIVNGYGNPDGVKTVWAYDLIVNPAGQDISTAQSITYTLMLLILIGVFLLSAYGFMTIKWGNQRNELGQLRVNWKKYLKMFCFTVCYVSLFGITFLAWNISYAFLYFDSLSNFFRMLYTFEIGLALPIIIVCCVFGIMQFMKDLKLDKMIKGGFTV